MDVEGSLGYHSLRSSLAPPISATSSFTSPSFPSSSSSSSSTFVVVSLSQLRPDELLLRNNNSNNNNEEAIGSAGEDLSTGSPSMTSGISVNSKFSDATSTSELLGLHLQHQQQQQQQQQHHRHQREDILVQQNPMLQLTSTTVGELQSSSVDSRLSMDSPFVPISFVDSDMQQQQVKHPTQQQQHFAVDRRPDIPSKHPSPSLRFSSAGETSAAAAAAAAAGNPEDLDVVARLRLLRQANHVDDGELLQLQDGLQLQEGLQLHKVLPLQPTEGLQRQHNAVVFDDDDGGGTSIELWREGLFGVGGGGGGVGAGVDTSVGAGVGAGVGGAGTETTNLLSYNDLYSQLNAELERDSQGLMMLKAQNSAV